MTDMTEQERDNFAHRAAEERAERRAAKRRDELIAMSVHLDSFDILPGGDVILSSATGDGYAHTLRLTAFELAGIAEASASRIASWPPTRTRANIRPRNRQS